MRWHNRSREILVTVTARPSNIPAALLRFYSTFAPRPGCRLVGTDVQSEDVLTLKRNS
jgi:hypothetical protein